MTSLWRCDLPDFIDVAHCEAKTESSNIISLSSNMYITSPSYEEILQEYKPDCPRKFIKLLHKFRSASVSVEFVLEPGFVESPFSKILLDLLTLKQQRILSLSIFINLLTSSSQKLVSDFLIQNNVHIFLVAIIKDWSVNNRGELICPDFDFFYFTLYFTANFVAVDQSNALFIFQMTKSSLSVLLEIKQSDIVHQTLRIFYSILVHDPPLDIRRTIIELISLRYDDLYFTSTIGLHYLLVQMSQFREFYEMFDQRNTISLLLNSYFKNKNEKILHPIMLTFSNVAALHSNDSFNQIFVKHYDDFLLLLDSDIHHNLKLITMSLFKSICCFLTGNQVRRLVQTSIMNRECFHGINLWSYGVFVCEYMKHLDDLELLEVVPHGVCELLMDFALSDHVDLVKFILGTMVRIVKIEFASSKCGGYLVFQLVNEDFLKTISDSSAITTDFDTSCLFQTLVTTMTTNRKTSSK